MWRFGLPFLAPVVLACLPFSAMAQSEDRDFLTGFLEDNLSGIGRNVTITGFAGALSSRATIEKMTIADDQGIWLTLTNVALDWNRSALFGGVVSVEALTVEEIVFDRPPVAANDLPAPEASGFALPELPVSLNIGELAAARIVLGPTVLGQPVEGRLDATLSLSGGEGSGSFSLARTDDGPDGLITLEGSYSNSSRNLVLDLMASEGAGGVAATLLGLPGAPETVFKIAGAGPIDDFSATMQLETDRVERLAGTVAIIGAPDGGTGFSVDLQGNPAPLFLPDYAEFFGTDVGLLAAGTRDASGRLAMDRFALDTRALKLAGTLVLAADGLPERFDLTGTLGVPGGEPVLLPIAGPVQTRVTSASVGIAFDAAQGDEWRGTLALSALKRSDFSAAQVVLTGSGTISRTLGDRVTRGDLLFDARGLQPADQALAEALGDQVSGSLTYGWQQDVDGLMIGALALDGADYGLAASGKVEGLDAAFRITGAADLRADALGRFSAFARRDLSGSAGLSVAGSGSLLGGDFDLQIGVAGQDLALDQAEIDGLLRGPSQIELTIARSTEGTTIRELSLQAGTLTAQGSGTVTSELVDLTATLAFGDLSVLGPNYGGAVNGTARVRGVPGTGNGSVEATLTGADLAVGQAEADRLLRGRSAIRLLVEKQADAILIRTLDVTAATASVQIAGRVVDQTGDLTAELDFSDLSVLGPAYGGSLSGTAVVTGAVDTRIGTLDASLRGQDLRIGQTEVDNLLRGPSSLTVAADAKGDTIALRDVQLASGTLRASVSGMLATAGSDLLADLAVSDLSVLGGNYRGAIRGTARLTGTPEAAQVAFDATTDNLAIGQPEADRLLRGTTVIAARIALQDGAIRVNRAQISNPQVDLLADGVANGADRRINLTARLIDLALIVPEFPGRLTVSGTAVQTAAGYDLDLRGQGPGQINATVTGRLAQSFATANLQLAGSAQAALANAFLGNRVVSGPVSFDLGLDGPLAVASLSGRVSLRGGRLADPALPFGLQDMSVTANLGAGQAQIAASAALTSGGRVRIDGSVGLAAPSNGDLVVIAEQIGLRDPQLYETTANGRITVDGPLAGGAEIAGRISLIETEVRIPSTGRGGSGPIADLRHVNEPAAVRATRERAGLPDDAGGTSGAAAGSARPFALNLTISAPNRLFIRGRGLDAELGGEVRLGGTTAAVVPSGQFSLIRGRLDILGKRLTLSEASLLLEGNFVPRLSVAASTESDGIVSSVLITGSASDPVIRFASVPELPQEEVLARLLFGRDLQSISPLQAAQLASAVATLAGQGGDGIVGRLRDSFGLDDLDVSTSATGALSVTAGRYLSENLYTEFSVDQDGKSQINLNLDLTPGVTVRGRAGSDGDTGIGIFLEKDY